MNKIWLEYVGSRTRDGIGQDHEHIKYYWGPDNGWKCEVPVILAGMLIENMGVDKFMPCLDPSAGAGINALELKKGQEELVEAEKTLEKGNLALQKRENAVKLKEDALDAREGSLNERAAEVKRVEKDQAKREEALAKKASSISRHGLKKSRKK